VYLRYYGWVQMSKPQPEVAGKVVEPQETNYSEHGLSFRSPGPSQQGLEGGMPLLEAREKFAELKARSVPRKVFQVCKWREFRIFQISLR
jgi:hypothetical protein